MGVRVTSLDKDSIRVRINFDVIGDHGHPVDCTGVLLGQGSVSLPPPSTIEDAAAAVVAEAETIYDNGYDTWVMRNELAPLLPEPIPAPDE